MAKQIQEIEYLPPFFWLMRWVRIQHGGMPEHEDINLELSIHDKDKQINAAIKDAQKIAGDRKYVSAIQTLILSPKHALQLTEAARVKVVIYPHPQFCGLVTTMPKHMAGLMVKLFIYIEGLQDAPNT